MPVNKKTGNPAPRDAIGAALKFLSRRPRSVKEVSDRLRSKGFQESESDAAVRELVSLGYLDDERFAALLTESRIRNKHWGAEKIAFELKGKGVTEEIIRKTLKPLDDRAETDVALEAFKKWARGRGLKEGGLEGTVFEKAYRHLRSRGLRSSVILQVLNRLKSVLG